MSHTLRTALWVEIGTVLTTWTWVQARICILTLYDSGARWSAVVFFLPLGFRVQAGLGWAGASAVWAQDPQVSRCSQAARHNQISDQACPVVVQGGFHRLLSRHRTFARLIGRCQGGRTFSPPTPASLLPREKIFRSASLGTLCTLKPNPSEDHSL